MKKISVKNLIKWIYSISGVILLFLIIARLSPAEPEEISRKNSDSGDAFAVIELFTSANCSSCPPAEKVVQQIGQNSARENKEVYILSFHVDFWDQPGAPDPFSSQTYSRYQQYYSHILRLRGIFTPQMIINGMTSFIGNDLQLCREQIASIATTGLQQPIKIKARATFQRDSIEIRFKLSRALNNARLNIALIQKKASMQMNSGENAGLFFECFNIVRAFKHIVDKDLREGSLKMALPGDLSAREVEIVLYTQNTLTYSISGATRI